MGKVLLNGREPLECELAAMERARQEPPPVHGIRPVTDIVWEFS